ncbi:GspH/FimT family pseudopilin [Paucibacter sp. B51]|uniref:GspH/FimT family pseudopilin n=1 Tax=Paucibacter sp. B51 TaxID=2993315 RepID=UPI0022EC081B|nr:GspH/FimT family pseudopilin [Paucibacter sp. B51]
MNRLNQSTGIRGVSLIEACVTLSIVSTLTAVALPSLQSSKRVQSLKALSQTLMTDLQQARGDTVLLGASTHFKTSSTAAGSCYVLYAGDVSACGCNADGQASCTTAGRLIRSQWVQRSSGLTMQANVTTLSFHSRQGTVTSTGHIDVSSQQGETLRHVIAITGRIRTCSPNGSIAGSPTCA